MARKKKADNVVDMPQAPTPKAPVEETKEELTKRLFDELNNLSNPLYNWLINNFDVNTSILVKKGSVTIQHDTMLMNILEGEAENGIEE